MSQSTVMFLCQNQKWPKNAKKHTPESTKNTHTTHKDYFIDKGPQIVRPFGSPFQCIEGHLDTGQPK